jgi:hypothetical protein
MAAQPEASTVAWATVEGSTAVVAALREVATQVAAGATVAESHGIQLSGVKSKRASWANPTVGPVSSALFDSLESGETLEEFLEGFPSAKRDMAIAALEQVPLVTDR